VYTQGDGIGAVGGKGGEGKAVPYFMVRIRIPNGQLFSHQLRTIAGFAERARGQADITVRENFQLHWVPIEDLPDLLESLWRSGLTSMGTCGDVTRNITGCPLAGVDADELVDASPLVQAGTRMLNGNPDFFNLPRKYKITITGCRAWCSYPEINDIGMTAVRHPASGEVGFSVRVGGGLSTNPHLAVRLGLRYVKGLREEMGKRIEDERRRGPFASAADLVKRTEVRRDELTQLARVGALASLEPERRAALWDAERAVRPRGALYDMLPDPPEVSPLRVMTPGELIVADYEGTGLSLGPHPMEFHRARLDRMRGSRASDLATMPHGTLVRVAGAVVVRQRPGTAKGFVFLNLEDETGLTNVIVRPALFHRHRLALVNEPFLYVEGTLQHQDNVVSIRAERLWPLRHRLTAVPSHDFH
jgi:hypothetical protein